MDDAYYEWPPSSSPRGAVVIFDVNISITKQRDDERGEKQQQWVHLSRSKNRNEIASQKQLLLKLFALFLCESLNRRHSEEDKCSLTAQVKFT